MMVEEHQVTRKMMAIPPAAVTDFLRFDNRYGRPLFHPYTASAKALSKGFMETVCAVCLCVSVCFGNAIVGWL